MKKNQLRLITALFLAGSLWFQACEKSEAPRKNTIATREKTLFCYKKPILLLCQQASRWPKKI
jgi:hypothetical protein